MSTPTFDTLSGPDRDDLLTLVARLEQASRPLRSVTLPADPVRRAALDEVLDARGRVLVHVPGDDGLVTTGYADDVADRLAAQGLGVLPPDDRAVLALVLLLCVAVPAARGHRHVPWSAAPPVPRGELDKSRLTDAVVRDGLRRLGDAGLVSNARSHGVSPGSALDRLTETQLSRIERDLLRLAAPDDPVIRRLLDRLDQQSPRPTIGTPA